MERARDLEAHYGFHPLLLLARWKHLGDVPTAPKGVLTEADLPGLQKALLAAAQDYVQGRRIRGDEG